MTDQDYFEIHYKQTVSEIDLSHAVQLKKIGGRYVFDRARWMWDSWQACSVHKELEQALKGGWE